jgi:CYTH domain-containing protein
MTDNVEIELELTYLARRIPVEVKNVTPQRLIDIYVPEESDYPCIRLRQKDEKYEITKKKPVNRDDFSVQTEQTIPLEEDEFRALAKASGRKVVKDRYRVEIKGVIAEVDIFGDELTGLVLIDFEFDSPEAKAKFQPQEYCLADVTQELFVAGGQLAGKSYTDIETDLERFNYVKLPV